MKLHTMLLIAIAASPAIASSLPSTPAGSAQIVVTVVPQIQTLDPDGVKIEIAKIPTRVLQIQSLKGDLADLQLFILLDDSARSSSLGIQLPELKDFIQSLPPTTEVAVGYMRNGTFGLVQGFTTDHAAAAQTLRLPLAMPGGNGSPYFALSDLAKRWPSQEPTHRRAVLMLTDGVDRYYDTETVDDPYVEASVNKSLAAGLAVSSIYLRDAGLYDRGGRVTNFAQSRLLQVSDATGGHAYFQGFTDPVSLHPFLADFTKRLDSQYLVTIEARNAKKGVQPLSVRSELRGVKIEGPTRVDLH
jgi:hypothetical protein